MAINEGLDPIQAIKMATINVAEHYKIPRKGAVVPGYWADLVVFDNFENLDIRMVFRSGDIIAENYQFIGKPRNRHVVKLRGTVNVGSFKKTKLKIPDKGNRIRIMELIKDQIITPCSILTPQNIQNGHIESDLKSDILKIAVVERHLATGNVGLGFVKGFGLKKGAIASTVAHDSHNIIVIGTNDEDMEFAVRELIDSQGGKIVVEEHLTKAILPLPIGGLMSRKGVREVAEEKMLLLNECKKLGCGLDMPFMAMSFLTLPVIPELKISDLGLINVVNHEIVELYVD
jgi:adenine deaminase